MAILSQRAYSHQKMLVLPFAISGASSTCTALNSETARRPASNCF